MKKTFLAILSLVISSIFASSAFAVTGTGNAKARVVTPISFNAGTDLEFGSFAPTATPGTIDQAGTVSPAGSVVLVSGGAPRSAGIFNLSGEPNAGYTISLDTNPITLISGANSMTANLTIVGGGSKTFDGTGNNAVTINGVLNVSANQPSGSYSVAYNVTANY